MDEEYYKNVIKNLETRYRTNLYIKEKLLLKEFIAQIQIDCMNTLISRYYLEERLHSSVILKNLKNNIRDIKNNAKLFIKNQRSNNKTSYLKNI